MNSWERDRMQLLRDIIKLPLDDDEEDMVNKRRFLKKNSYVSRHWSTFSTEYALMLSKSSNSEAIGVNKGEFEVSQYGNMINTMSWSFK